MRPDLGDRCPMGQVLQAVQIILCAVRFQPRLDGDIDPEGLIDYNAVQLRNQQPDPVEKRIWDDGFDEIGRDLAREREFLQGGPDGITVGPDEPSFTELRASEVTGDDGRDIAQPAAAQDGQGGAPGGAGRFAVVMAVLDD